MASSSTLLGHRVKLRPVVAADRARVIAIRSTEQVSRWWRGGDLAQEFGDDLDDDELHQLAIETLDGVVAGVIQFSEEDDPDYRHASVDVYINPALQRQGLASDAIVTLARHLFRDRGHHRLVIDPSVDNEAAIACYRTCGFRPVGIMRSYERRADGTWSDGLLMDLLRADLEPA
ncbi:MAG TPA: GNAT family N-acetyltransferase [Acidimicrobiaceae bacterium]|nr:GNAT family N-acetyltransferase [Acidimicrobiaceae bacterium]